MQNDYDNWNVREGSVSQTDQLFHNLLRRIYRKALW